MPNTDLLKYVIIREGLSTNDIAELLGISRQSLNLRFNGEIEFRLSEVRKLCDKLSLTEQEVQDIFFA